MKEKKAIEKPVLCSHKDLFLYFLKLSTIGFGGPLAAQLAMYICYIRYGVLGISVVALAFIGPSFLIVIAISILYVKYGGLPFMQELFYGIGAAVIGIINTT